jgi:DNA-binding NtrC family response regulator
MNRKILAVEDDKDTLSNLQDILELDGFEVTGASSLREATAQDHWSDYAVILLDRKLPDGTADDALPRIRAEAPRAAVIIITGYADLEGTIAALRSGASDYLLKPVNPDLLRKTVDRAMRLHEMEEKVVQSERLAAIGQMMTVLTHESGNILARGDAVLEMLELDLGESSSAMDLIGRLKKSQADLRKLYE